MTAMNVPTRIDDELFDHLKLLLLFVRTAVQEGSHFLLNVFYHFTFLLQILIGLLHFGLFGVSYGFEQNELFPLQELVDVD